MTEAENPERKTGAIKKAVEAMVAAIKNEQPEKQHKQPSSAKKAEVKPRQTIPLEKVVTTTENGVKKHEWTTIKSKPIDEVKKHISSARGKGGVLREIVPSVLPQDEQLLQLLDEVAYMREKGASPMDAYQFYQHNRSTVLGVEGEQGIYSRLWLSGREEPITDRSLAEVATEGVGTPIKAHPPDIEIDDSGLTTTEGKEAIKLVQQLWGTKYDDPDLLSKVIERLENKVLDGDIPQADAVNMKTKLEELRDWAHQERQVSRKKEYAAREEGREKYFSNIGLQESAMEGLWRGGKEAEWVIEEYLQLIERATKKYPSGEIGEALHHRLGLIASYFSDKQYVNDLQEYAAKKIPNDIKKQQVFVEDASNQIFLLQEKIQSRIGALVTYGHIKLKGDPETISQSLLQLGTRGVNFILAENGGVNERVFNRYVSLMKLGRFNPINHSEEPYTAETLFELRKRIKDEIKHDIGLYNQQYQSYWGEAHQLDDKVIDSMVRQVEVVVSITQQDLVALREAPGPERRVERQGDVLASSSFLSMSTAERFLSAMDVDSYAFEKWSKLTDYPLYMWRKTCELAAIGSGRHETSVSRLLEGVKQGDAKFLELAKLAFGSENKMSKLLKLEKQANPGIFPWLKNTSDKFNDLTLQQLKHELTIREGKMIVTEILEAYDNFSSGWRIRQYLIQLNRMYGIEVPPLLSGSEIEEKYLYGPHHLGLGMQLRLAGYDLIHAESEKGQLKREEKVKRILKNEIALYRPQAIFEFLNNNADQDAQKWFQEEMVAQGKLTKRKLGGISENITHVDQFYHYISRNFIAINDSLADAGLGPVNYETGHPTKKQMETVNKVCNATGTNAKAYVQIMKETSEFAQQEGNLDKLVQTEYYHIYHRTKWVDDLRMRYLENPDTAPGSRTKKEFDETSVPHIKLSETFVEDGSGGGDQLPRSWNDLGVALQTLDFLTLALTHDKKQFFENVRKVYDGVARYSGYTPAAGRAAIYLLGGFGESAATDKELNLFMLNAIENSSPAKRLVGDKGLSHSPGQNLELTEEFEGLLMSKLRGLAPHLAEEAEKFIGIRWGWVPDSFGEIGHHLPAWADRAKIAAILIGLLIITQSVKEAEKEASGKDTKH